MTMVMETKAMLKRQDRYVPIFSGMMEDGDEDNGLS